MTTHWHGATSVPGPVDPDGCGAAEATPNRTEKVALSEPENEHDGCDCTELCSMGPTCPGGSLAGLPGSGCWRTKPTAAERAAEQTRLIEHRQRYMYPSTTPTAASIAAELRAEVDRAAAERLAKGLRGGRT